MYKISSHDIAHWATSHQAAASLLPELVRRLIWAQAAPLHDINFPSGREIQRRGYDGIVLRDRTPSAFVPPELSVWELSVNQDPKQKAKDDYAERTAALDPQAPPAATYVALTAQRWPGADAWAAERSAEGKWVEVRAYDASTLEQWLEVSPTVAVWLSRWMGRPQDKLVDALGYLRRWQEQVPRFKLPRLMTDVQEPLPPLAHLLLVGRGAEAEHVRRWATSPHAAPLKVHAERRDEAIAFVCAALAAPLWEPSKHIAPSVVVAESAEAMDKMLASREPNLILLSDFEGPSRPGAQHAHIMLFTERPELEALVLRPQLSHDLARGLNERLGVPLEEANRLAREARGLHALRRVLGMKDEPKWASEQLVPALLLGQWSLRQHRGADGAPRFEHRDHEVLARSWGLDIAQVEEQVLHPASRGVESPLVRHDGEWCWRARRDAWRQMSGLISQGRLNSFGELAVEVLSEDSPLIGVVGEERWALVWSRPAHYSEALRLGVAEGLACLAVPPSPLAQGVAADVGGWVERILGGASFARWGSLGDVLSLLAEAHPVVFMREVEAFIEAGDVSKLFVGGSRWASAGRGLLAALSLLARSSELEWVRRAVKALCQLAPHAEQAQEPVWEELEELFHPHWPRSSLSFEQHRRIMSWIAGQSWGRSLAWKVRLSWLNGMDTTLSGRQRSPWRGWGRVDTERTSEAGYLASVRAEGEGLLAQAIAEPARWPELLNKRVLSNLVGLGCEEAVVEALRASADGISASEHGERILWEVRTLLHWIADDEPLRSLYDALLALYEAELAPSAELERRWLFEEWVLNDPRDGGYSAEALNARRDAVLLELYAERGLEGWQQLVDEIRGHQSGDVIAGHLGYAVSEAQLWEVVEGVTPQVGREELFWSVFFYSRVRRGAMGFDGLVALLERVEGLPAARREVVRVSALRCLPLTSETLAYLEEPGREALRALYWRHREVWLVDEVEPQVALVALDKWLEQGRWAALMRLFGYRGAWRDRLKVHDRAALVEVIQRLLWGSDEASEEVWGEEGMDRVDDVHALLIGLGGYDEERLCLFELRRFARLRLGETPALLKRLGRDPAFFVEVLSLGREAARVLESPVPPLFEDDAALIYWVDEVLSRAEVIGLATQGAEHVGSVMARLGGEGDVWPRRAVCEVLERDERRAMVWDGFFGEVMRQNGSMSGGERERERAARYRAFAEQWDAELFEVPVLLRQIAARFEWWARREDDEAERMRRRDGLYNRAGEQEGLFSIQQAEEDGFAGLIPEWMEQGRLEEVRSGVYRITSFDVPALQGEGPIDQVRQSRIALWLWSRKEGVFSHDTALELHGLSDANPSKIHLTLPSARQGHAKGPDEALVLHFADVGWGERQWIEDVPVTSAARTVNDCAAAHILPDLLRDAVEQGVARGLFREEEIAPALGELERIGVKVGAKKAAGRA